MQMQLQDGDYLAALRLHARWTRRRWIITALVMLAAAVVGWASFPHWPAVAAGAVVGGIIGSVVWRGVAWWWYLPRLARRVFAQQRILHESMEVAWSEAGLSMRQPQASSITSWANYLRRRQDERVLLLYHSEVLFQMLPRRAFDAIQWQQLQAWVERVPVG